MQQYAQQYMTQYNNAYPGQPQPQYQPPYQPQPVVQGQFDAGARFSAQAPASIPPPPPGVMPTPAQMAAMSGQQVIMGQKEGGFLKGSGSGGYTFW